MRANYISTENISVSDGLCSQLPRDCQEVTLLLNQGIFLRNRKKKLIGTISMETQQIFSTQFSHLEKI